MKKHVKLSFLLGALFVASLANFGISRASFPGDKPTLWVDDYEFNTLTDLTGTKFNVTVNIFNVTGMWGCAVKLGYNNSLLAAVRVYPTDITEYAPSWLPIDWNLQFHWDADPTINNTRTYAPDYAYVWVFAFDFLSFDGSGSVFTMEFTCVEAPLPNESVSCVLDLFDTEVLDSWSDPIDHYVDDGSYTYARGHPVGGIYVPIDKLALLVPYIALAATIILAVSISVAIIKYRKKQ